jgi:hypothetical protein
MSQPPPEQSKEQLVTPSQRKWQPPPAQANWQLPTPSQVQVAPGWQLSTWSPGSRASTTHPPQKK